MRRVFLLLGLLAGIVLSSGVADGVAVDPPGQPGVQPVKHGRGHKRAPKEVRDRLHNEAFKRHGHRVKSLPRATAVAFDCRTAPGYVVLPANDQGSCGDCFGVSSADGCSMALAKAGIVPASEAGRLSSQYGLDNSQAFQGGCNGGDEAQVIDFIKTNGFPLTKDYGPYTASPGRLKPLTGMQVYKIGDWGYCTPSQQEGVAATDDIKACMIQYGPISVAFDAGECDSYKWPGTMTGTGTGVDHAVLCIGWDDNHDNGDGSKGAFLGMNQWGQANASTVTFPSQAWGGPNGTFWIKYGADSWGTEAIWITAGTPPTPTPVPPTPVPPTPPAAGVPAITSALTANAALTGPFTYQIMATNTPTAYGAAGLPAGLSISTTGLISGTPTVLGTSTVLLIAVNASGVGTANLVLTVTATPTPVYPPVAVTLTSDQVQSVITASGVVTIRKEMTLTELSEALTRCTNPAPPPVKSPCPCDKKKEEVEQRLDKLERGVDAILKALLPTEKAK